jgi:defect-in-organelle-trafficking protein DotA
MKTFIKYAFFFGLLLLCGHALADDGTGLPSSLTPTSNDQSRYYLGLIFGNVGSVLSSNGSQILGIIFGEFNRAVLILGTLIFTYVYGKGVLDTAAHGEFLGEQANSLWVPIRSIGGLALMIPKASTGYCVIQVFLMWVVLQGVGAADMIWTTLAANLNSSSSGSQQNASAVISASIATQMTSQVQNIFTSLVCVMRFKKAKIVAPC